MRHLFIFISFLTITSKVLSQGRRVDAFFQGNGFVTTRILLSSDNTFFIAESNCTEASIARGKWKVTNRNIQLLPDKPDNISIKPKIYTDNSFADTVVTFKVQDYFNQPLAYYYLTFYDQEGETFEYEADKNGILRISKGKFTSFMTFHEMFEFDFTKDIRDYAHTIDNKTSTITLEINYPKEILRERPNVRSFQYTGDEFRKTKKLLKSTKSKLTLTRL